LTPVAQLLTEAEWAEQLRTFDRTAFRFECQSAYAEAEEADTVRRFLAGDRQAPTQVPELRAWFDQVAGLVAGGRRIERVRVHDAPPTPYQRWLRWIDQWNTEVGEVIRYITRAQAHAVGLGPALTNIDWWLMDEQRLIVMRFDGAGRRVENELVTDPGPVAQACTWRDLAVHHATLDNDVRGDRA
jgi:hypothetical protein